MPKSPPPSPPPVSCSVCGAEVKDQWDVERHAREHASAVAPEEPPEIREAIGNLIDAVREYEKLHVPYTDDEWSGIVDTARAALISIYTKLQAKAEGK